MTTTPDPAPQDMLVDQVSERRLDWLRKTVCKGATNAEIATFLELCGRYDLDPAANEVWCVVSERNGSRNVLLMVGRDGRRKIAQRQGMVIDGDVVHENDEFTVERNPDRSRTITHRYASRDRGAVIGAWAEVYDTDGKQRGFFYALMSEYRPTSEAKLRYSPWGSQESVMILAAAERTALSMATPLSGVLAPGELDAGEERKQLGEGNGDGEPEGIPLPPAVEEVMVRAQAMGLDHLIDRASVEMEVGEQPAEFVAEWVARANAEMDAALVDGEAVEDA